MEHIITFLGTSTIHGLSYISSTRKWLRLFWIFVVLGGFSVAGYLIYTSFNNWKQSPISTTIETLPISQITFPNVTVCPPKNLFLNLNYDILQSENVKLDNNTREQLIEASLNAFQDHFYKEVMVNITKVEDPDRYYNLYHGNTAIQYPFYSGVFHQLMYNMVTNAASGNISTQYFDDKFDAEKVDANIYIIIYIKVPPKLVANNNSTLLLNIEKRTIKEANDQDRIAFDCDYYCSTKIYFDADSTHWIKNITPIPKSADIVLDRKVSQDDIRNMKLEMMPGFRFVWNFDTKIEPETKYKNYSTTKQFVR